MAKKKKPKKWADIYPVGTPEGDEEAKFFKTLARNPKYEWRSTAALIKESGLNKKRVDEIISKYHKLGLIFQSPKNEDHWGYWERVPDMLPDVDQSLAKKDQNSRIDKALKDCEEKDLGDAIKDLAIAMSPTIQENKTPFAKSVNYPAIYCRGDGEWGEPNKNGNVWPRLDNPYVPKYVGGKAAKVAELKKEFGLKTANEIIC
jgi:hypothetical protein